MRAKSLTSKLYIQEEKRLKIAKIRGFYAVGRVFRAPRGASRHLYK